MRKIPAEQTHQWGNHGNDGSYVSPRHVESVCHQGHDLVATPLVNWILAKGTTVVLTTTARCNVSDCNFRYRIFLFEPELDFETKKPVYMFPAGFVAGTRTRVASFSSRYASIMEQVAEAGISGLNELRGMGLRKALEFLVKDYLISIQYRDEDDDTDDDKKRKISKRASIPKKFLGKCIREDIEDIELKRLAKPAAWLGNDEVHYAREWAPEIPLLERLLGYMELRVESMLVAIDPKGELKAASTVQ